MMAWRSISSLLARNAQLEREALESEARVAELQVLRGSMERRLRLLEQQQMASRAQCESGAQKALETDAQLGQREASKAEPANGKSSKKSGRR
jgi:chemotaxis protein MotB